MSDAPPTLTDLTTYLLSRIGKVARVRVSERFAARGLRMWHMAVLAALADFGPQSQRDLAERLSIDRSDITKILDDLTGTSAVERSRDSRDRRRITVAITLKGSDLLAELAADARAVQDELLATLTTADRARLHAALAEVFIQAT